MVSNSTPLHHIYVLLRDLRDVKAVGVGYNADRLLRAYTLSETLVIRRRSLGYKLIYLLFDQVLNDLGAPEGISVSKSNVKKQKKQKPMTICSQSYRHSPLECKLDNFSTRNCCLARIMRTQEETNGKESLLCVMMQNEKSCLAIQSCLLSSPIFTYRSSTYVALKTCTLRAGTICTTL